MKGFPCGRPAAMAILPVAALLGSCKEPGMVERARQISYHREKGVELVQKAQGTDPERDLPILEEALAHLERANELAGDSSHTCRAAYAECFTMIGLSHLEISVRARDDAKRLRRAGELEAAKAREAVRDRERAQAESFLRKANVQYRLYERRNYPKRPLPKVYLRLSQNYEILEDYENSLLYMRRFLGEAEEFLLPEDRERCLRKVEELEDVVRRAEETEEAGGAGSSPPVGRGGG